MYKLALIVNLVIIILSAIVAIAFYTLRERKFLGYFQYRKGPNKPSIIALITPIADAAKLFIKEEKFITLRNIKHYLIAPIIIIVTALLI